MEHRSDDQPQLPLAGSDAEHHAYLVALLVLMGIDVASYLTSADAPVLVRAAHLLLPAVGTSLLLLFLTVRRTGARASTLACPAIAATLLVRLGAVLFGADLDTAPGDLVPDSTAAAFVVVFLLAATTFDRLRAAVGSAVLALSAFAMVAARIALVPDVSYAENLLGPLQVLAVHAAVIVAGMALSFTDRQAPAGAEPAPGPTGARIVPGTDPLTGLTNEAPLRTALEREIARSERHLLPLSVILIGLDDLQGINERHGPRVGDSVLLEVSHVLAGVLRSVDTIGRWGGDEFLVLAPTTGPQDAQALAMRCRYKLRHHPMPEVGPVTASFGVSTFELGDDPTTLVERATEALANAKAAGRDRVEVTSVESRIASEGRRRSDSGA